MTKTFSEEIRCRLRGQPPVLHVRKIIEHGGNISEHIKSEEEKRDIPAGKNLMRRNLTRKVSWAEQMIRFKKLPPQNDRSRISTKSLPDCFR